jgi:hypothetical protein
MDAANMSIKAFKGMLNLQADEKTLKQRTNQQLPFMVTSKIWHLFLCAYLPAWAHAKVDRRQQNVSLTVLSARATLYKDTEPAYIPVFHFQALGDLYHRVETWKKDPTAEWDHPN